MKQAKSRKRPKSIMKKAWETRRANSLSRSVKTAASTMNEVLYGDNANPMKPDSIVSLIDQYREEQLCGFLADMVAARNMARSNMGNVGHFPIMVTHSQVQAIEELLRDHGYSPFGKGSGSLMSVSTNPNAKAA